MPHHAKLEKEAVLKVKHLFWDSVVNMPDVSHVNSVT
jgi:hypothetical protein